SESQRQSIRHREPRRPEREIFSASSACLFVFRFHPPWTGINRSPVLAELNIEHGTRCPAADRGRGGGGSVAHHGNRLAGEDELTKRNIDLFNPAKQHKVPAATIDDQELPKGSERSRERHPAVAGRRDGRSSPSRQGNALGFAAEAVRCAE